MATTKYRVSQGEHLTSITRQFGFPDGDKVWNHPDNAELRESRQHVHVLSPGDILSIPEPETKVQSCATEQRHRFQLHTPSLVLRLSILDHDGEPVSGADCGLQVESEKIDLTTDGKGQVEQRIPADAVTGELTVNGVSTPLKIGHLDPVDLPSGQRARLNNLGIYAGEMGDADSEDGQMLLRSAVEEFQCDQGLTVDGICGPKTQARLAEVYGT
jgi:N-acetylmuramoyl-L-alanine amidase